MSQSSKKIECPKDFDITEDEMQNFDKFISINVGLTKEEIIKKYEGYNFNMEKLEWLLYVIKRNANTFNGVGPFLEKEGRIYNIKKKKNDTINALVEENSRLKERIKQLEDILAWREDLHKHQYV